jgi:hypothetical protein
MNSIEITISRGLDINLILQQIVDWGLTLDNLTICRRDSYMIDLGISSKYNFDLCLFEEFLQELEYEHDMKELA